MVVSEHISDMIGISLLLSDQNWNITSHEKKPAFRSYKFELCDSVFLYKDKIETDFLKIP